MHAYYQSEMAAKQPGQVVPALGTDLFALTSGCSLIKPLLCFIIGLLLATGCISAEAQSEAKPTELLIDLSDMPANWYVVSQGEPPDNHRQQAGASIQFNADNPQALHVAAHYVYQYRSERQAAREFERLLPVEFNNSSVASRSPWRLPPELPYTSPVADQFHFACHMSEINQVATICQVMARYANYLTIFHTRVVPEYMTYTDIDSILRRIDSLAADHLIEESNYGGQPDR